MVGGVTSSIMAGVTYGVARGAKWLWEKWNAMVGTKEAQASQRPDGIVDPKGNGSEVTFVAEKGDTTKMRDLGGFGYCDMNGCKLTPPGQFPQDENIAAINDALTAALKETLRQFPPQACSEVAAVICGAATAAVLVGTKNPAAAFGTLGACGLTAVAVCRPTAPPPNR